MKLLIHKTDASVTASSTIVGLKKIRRPQLFRVSAIYIRQGTLTVPLAPPMKTVCTLGSGDELK